MVSGRLYGDGLPRTLRPVQYTKAPASPSARAMPRPAPRVAPATSATCPFNGRFITMNIDADVSVNMRDRRPKCETRSADVQYRPRVCTGGPHGSESGTRRTRAHTVLSDRCRDRAGT